MTTDDLRALLDAANEPTGRQLRALSTPDTVAALARIALAAAGKKYWFVADRELISALRAAGLI